MAGDLQLDRYILAVLIAFLIAVCATPLIREFARYRSLLDNPNARSSHRIPVPRLGGLAIFLGTLAGGALIIREPNRDMMVIAGASLIMVGMGLIDDFRTIGVIAKYVAQLIAAIMISVWMEPEITFVLPFWDVSLGAVSSIVLSVVFILAVVNALNFLDGIDGIAAGVAIVVAFAAVMLSDFSLLALMLPLMASLAGFMCWNMDPASIFMGDSGSQLVGFVLAIGLLYRPDRQVDFMPVLICLLALFADTGFTLLRRLVAGKNIFEAHQEHLYQRMVRSGYAHRSVANLYYVLTGLCALLAYGYRDGGPVDRLLILFGTVFAFGAFAMVVFALERGILKISVVLPSAKRTNIVTLNGDMASTDEIKGRDDAVQNN